MVQMPQKANKRATDMIKRLSVERFLGISSRKNKPNTPPSSMTPTLISTGLMTTQKLICPAPPETEASANEMAML